MPMNRDDEELLTEASNFRETLNDRAMRHIDGGADQPAGHLLALERRIYVAMNKYALAEGLTAVTQEVAAAAVLTPSPREVPAQTKEKCRHSWTGHSDGGTIVWKCDLCGTTKSPRGRKAKAPAAAENSAVQQSPAVPAAAPAVPPVAP